MKRRDFLTRTAAGVSAGLFLGNVRFQDYRFVSSALAAGEGERQKATLEACAIPTAAGGVQTLSHSNRAASRGRGWGIAPLQ